MWTVWLFFLEVVQRNCNQLYLADQQFILKKSPALLQEMINVICQLIIMARSREGKKRNFIIKPSKYVSFVILHKVFGSCGKLNLWYLEMPKCTFALFTVMREFSILRLKHCCCQALLWNPEYVCPACNFCN